MTRDLSRLLRPSSVAIIGGGAWCRLVLEQLTKSAFGGEIWLVHPKGGQIDGRAVFPDLAALPMAPDAAFIGVNRDATIQIVAELSNMNAGGAVCFASGFAEVSDGDDRNAALLTAAADMPILGPNCYGMINNLDGALLWPDQHGCVPVDSGVAILTQSSNIAINLTMQSRALPISYVVTCGNQAQTTQADIALGLLDDSRVTAIGLHIEGFGDLAKWQNLARLARAKNIPLVAIKVGRSVQAQAATISHTASLAGDDAGAAAVLERLGIARVDDLPTFLETLKILHVTGPLANGDIATISCSGGEASLAADLTHGTRLSFPPLNQTQHDALFAALGPRVALANPLDYHTYVWRDTAAMTAAFSAMIDPDLSLTMLIVDFPRADRCDPADWDCAVDAARATRAQTGGNVAMVATLPELMPEHVATTLLAGGVIPLSGLREALMATQAAIALPTTDLDIDICAAPSAQIGTTLTEAAAKTALAAYGLRIPQQRTTGAIADIDLSDMPFPVVLKGAGIAHKTEAGAVTLNLPDMRAVQAAASAMPTEQFLIEEMITGTVAELLIGVIKDPAHGFVLTIGAGGVLTELMQDSASILVPSSEICIYKCLTRLKIHKLLHGYRGAPAADIDAIMRAIMAVQDYVLANVDHLQEIEINPLICTPDSAIAADALIRTSQ
ncbi:MAG: acetate--CoA ligase family protein [Yoonia sp.]|nr:acetate--CoA ligase family protein [Yoonia sp.]